ncbi:MAG: ABC transporter permease subunit [Frankia sp.]
MTWFIWRQHRGQALWVAVTLATICTLMLWVGVGAAHALHPFRVAGCIGPDPSLVHPIAGHSCAGFERFAHRYGYTIPVFELGVPLVLAVVGALAGAPLVAREIEQRTHLVAWTQSVTRTRWYRSKVVALGAVLTGVGLIAGFANYRLSRPLTDGRVTASRWPWFFSVGLAPAGEALLAFALAVAIGAWTRRTLPAVGAALVGFLVLLFVTGSVVKSLTPVSRTTGPRFVVPDDGWIIRSSDGQNVPFHPNSQFWPLQMTFLAILFALAGGLLALGWRATRTRAV